MQNVPGWPADSPVRVPSVAATVNGAPRDITDVTVRASVRATDVSARTGEVTWEPLTAVHRRQETPLDASSPKRGDRVTIDAGLGDARARVFTGKVETTSTRVPGDLVSDIVDDWDLLTQKVNVSPLAAVMFPREAGGALRSVGLTATAITQRILSLCGFYATPPAQIGTMLSASLNGTLWAENGVLQNSQTMPGFTAAPWGEAARGFSASYAPGSRTMADGSLEISYLVSPEAAAGASWVAAMWGTWYIRLTYASGSVAAQYSAGTPTNILTLSLAELSGVSMLRLRVSQTGDWSLTTDTGITKTGTQLLPEAMKTTSPSSWDVYVPTDGRKIGGVNAGFPNVPGPSTFTPTAQIDPADGTLSASRAIVSVPAIDVLQERAHADQARMWIDGHGVFHWRNRDTWGTGPTQATLSDVDLLSYDLSIDYDALYSGATVTYSSPLIEMRRQPTVALFQGVKQSLSAGDVERTFVEVPSDEDWYAMDQFVGVLGGAALTSNFNKGVRSFDSAVRVASDGTAEFFAYSPGSYATFDLEQITTQKWVHTVTVSASLPSDQTVETRAPDLSKMTSTGIWSQWNTFATPILRGHGRAVWIETNRYGTATTTTRLPRLEHDCGWWLQGGAPQRLADWLATRYTTPVVTIRNLSITPDERLEIGDVITIADKTYADLTVRAVITGIDIYIANGRADMSLDVEIVEVVASRRTYDTVQAEASWRTYAQFQALIGAVTYAEQEAG